MAYVSQEKKKQIAALIAPVLKKYGVKATLSVDNHTSLNLNIKSGKIDFIGNYNETQVRPFNIAPYYFTKAPTYLQVNHYHYDKSFTGKALDFFSEIIPLMNTGNYDNSDAMTDYFDVGFYIHVNVGRWDKPYILVK